MRELEATELKSIAANILFDFDRVCRELCLRYSIGFGTMIGAVRHHGFIPWDDDIDVIMPREDFEILAKEGANYLQANHKLLSINIDKRFGAPLPKIIDTATTLNQIGHVSEKMNLGVYIDIFIMDKIPDDVLLQKRLFKKCKFWQAAWSFTGNAPAEHKRGPLGVIRKIANKTNLAVYYARKLMNINKLTRSFNSSLYTIMVFNAYNYEKNIRSINDFDKCIDIEFEGQKVKIFDRYDEYLRIIYGDYMELPPLEQQVTHHDFVAYIN